MSSRITLSLICLVATISAGGCASSGASSTDPATAKDLAEMKERILELQEQAAMTEVELDRLQAEVKRLRQRLAGSDPTPPASPAAGPVEREPEQAPETISNISSVAVEESDIETEPSGGNETEAAQPAEVGGAGGVPPAGATTASQPVEPAAQALYDRGYTLYHQGKYLDAEASFQRFLQAYPNTELSDNAQFWIGESRYARDDIQGAMAAFREVIQKYPEGNKVPDALIKEGDCLDRLGDRDGARDRFEEVRRRFPNSGAAVMAEDRLSKLDG